MAQTAMSMPHLAQYCYLTHKADPTFRRRAKRSRMDSEVSGMEEDEDEDETEASIRDLCPNPFTTTHTTAKTT